MKIAVIGKEFGEVGVDGPGPRLLVAAEREGNAVAHRLPDGNTLSVLRRYVPTTHTLARWWCAGAAAAAMHASAHPPRGDPVRPRRPVRPLHHRRAGTRARIRPIPRTH